MSPKLPNKVFAVGTIVERIACPEGCMCPASRIPLRTRGVIVALPEANDVVRGSKRYDVVWDRPGLPNTSQRMYEHAIAVSRPNLPEMEYLEGL